MKFHEFGNNRNPHIMLIHGGGNAWWNYLRQARVLSQSYHLILPTLDGHGEEYATTYVSTENSAKKLIDYIDKECNSELFCLCGVSLGGQIVIEMLSQRYNITKKAIIDGCICYPQHKMAKICTTFVRIFAGIMFSKSSCKLQIGILKFFPNMRFPDELANYYINEMPLLRKETLYRIYKTYMGEYQLKECISNTSAQVMYWYGSKEMMCVKRSAKMFVSLVPSCEIYEAKGYNHSHLAVYLPEEWLKIVIPFLQK